MRDGRLPEHYPALYKALFTNVERTPPHRIPKTGACGSNRYRSNNSNPPREDTSSKELHYHVAWLATVKNHLFVIKKTDVVMCNITDAKMTHNYII